MLPSLVPRRRYASVCTTPQLYSCFSGEANGECHSQETPQQPQYEAAAEHIANAPVHVTDRSADTDKPAVSPGDSDVQPLPEEVLAAGLIPPHPGLSRSAETAEESIAAAAITDTLSNELQTDVVQQAPQVQIQAPEVPAPSSTSKATELDPNSTAALIQVSPSQWVCQSSMSPVYHFLARSTRLLFLRRVIASCQVSVAVCCAALQALSCCQSKPIPCIAQSCLISMSTL